MLVRALIAVAAVAAAYGLYRWWARPPRWRGRLDLPWLGVPGPAVILFSTPTCGPCKAVAPALREAAGRNGVAYAEVDVAGRPEVAGRYRIRTVPTVAVAAEGGEVLGVWTRTPALEEVDEAAGRARAAALRGGP